ncbi:hypothetical protein GF358_02215 [Candidatus Woesearchaeota archaeon]|nr:hypothetical protein [Candidatus Woesearchaeota archaeon]
MHFSLITLSFTAPSFLVNGISFMSLLLVISDTTIFIRLNFKYSYVFLFCMSKILFVCHANVGRSQMAEAYYNFLTNSKDAVSAGNMLDIENRYPKLPCTIVNLMSEEGIPINSQKPKTVTPEMVDVCDRMYVLCPREQCLDFVVNSEKAVFWNVKDPYNVTFENMRKIRDKIRKKVESVI